MTLTLFFLLPADVWTRGRVSRRLLLERFFSAVRERDERTAVHNTIDATWSVSFEHLGQEFDFTVHKSVVATGHGPTKLSTAMEQALDERPPVLRPVMILVVVVGTCYRVCFDREGAIDKQLKNAHAALLGLVWWQYEGCRASRKGDHKWLLLCTFLRWIRDFDLEQWRIEHLLAVPCAQREALLDGLVVFVEPFSLCSLVAKVDDTAWLEVRKAAKTALHEVLNAPTLSWQGVYERQTPIAKRVAAPVGHVVFQGNVAANESETRQCDREVHFVELDYRKTQLLLDFPVHVQAVLDYQQRWLEHGKGVTIGTSFRVIRISEYGEFFFCSDRGKRAWAPRHVLLLWEVVGRWCWQRKVVFEPKPSWGSLPCFDRLLTLNVCDRVTVNHFFDEDPVGAWHGWAVGEAWGTEEERSGVFPLGPVVPVVVMERWFFHWPSSG